MDSPLYLNLVQQTLQQTVRVMPKTFTLNTDYDLIKFEDGYEKPTKEVFYTKYNELLKNTQLEKLRSQRNEKLRHSDFSMLPDYNLTPENENEWIEYRQALRDLPSTTEDPENPIWPEPPQVKIIPGQSTTRTQLEEELQTTQTQLETTRTDLTETQTQIDETRTQLEQALEAEKVKTKNLESRIAFLETAVASLIS